LLLTGIGVWYFFPTTGEPVLAEINGAGLSLERAGHPLVVSQGLHLQPGDILRTTGEVTASLDFFPENTRSPIHPRTEAEFDGILGGKRFSLHSGKVTAVVARQRPFRPLVFKTPQAEARVVGTRFTLTVTPTATRLDVVEGKVQLTRTSDLTSVRVAEGR